MKNSAALSAICMVLFLFLSFHTKAQTPGLIVRPAGGPYSSVLDPNLDGFTSPTNSGFITTDVGVGNSEIPYKVIPPFKLEPTSDLMRGPNELFSDLVRLNADESGFYVFSTGGANPNLLFRMRLGAIVSGSKGYSVLIDADQKFGATGPYADPNYQAATTGSNGNPGFEFEVVLETNFRVAVYNVDGGATPTLINSYSTTSNSQISIALSTVSGTPDYFYDFYVPLSTLTGVSVTTPLRMSATTVMAPQAAIGGPKSDIFGYDGTDYMKAWETIITNQPAFTANDVTASGAGVGATCTAAPTLKNTISAGATSFTGTWTRSDATKPSTATITLYKNNIAIGSVLATTDIPWTITVAAANAAVVNDVFYAKAQSGNESACLSSNSVKASRCINLTPLTNFTVTCASPRGMAGTRPAGASIKLYTMTTAGITVFATDNIAEQVRIEYPTATTWEYQGANRQNSDPCGGGATDLAAGTYGVTVQQSGMCESDFIRQCIGSSGNNSTVPTGDPTISSAIIYTGATSFSGTAPAGSLVRLFINGLLSATTTAATAGTYSFSSLILNTGDLIGVSAQSTGACVSNRITRTVTCFTSAPIITTGIQGNLTVGATSIKGTSSEPLGTTIRVYDNLNAVVGTTTVQSGGTWSVAVTVASGNSYYAKAQNGTCAESAASASANALAATTVCPTITVPSGGYLESNTAITGTINTFSGIVRLYQDGTWIASSPTLTNATSWSIPVNQNISTYADKLYAGGVLTVSAQAASSTENGSCTSTTTVQCTPPLSTFTVSPISTSAAPFIVKSITQDIIISGSENGILYTLEDNTGVDKATSKFGNGGVITLSVISMPTTTGTYNWRVKATKITGTCNDTFKQIYFVGTDNDNDNIADFADIDDDNDGILDANETAMYDATGDADGDGILNYKDNNPGSGLPGTDSNGDGIVDYYDTDLDGIINQFDLDTDNDGIPDIIENGGTDSDNDGKVDGVADIDGDGLRDAVDANKAGVANSLGLAVLDFDLDTIPNYKDLDSDGDGITDLKEAGFADANNDGFADGNLGSDGWSDTIDALPALNLPNTDNTGKADYLDIDSDDDGITDNVEGQATATYQAPLNADADADGIDNRYDNTIYRFGGLGILPIDFDGDGTPDFRDKDSDGDMDPDYIEGNDYNLNKKADDVSNNIPVVDADGDGLLDFFEMNINNGPIVTTAGYAGLGSRSTIQQTPAGATNRDWRNASFSLTSYTILPVNFVLVAAKEEAEGVMVSWVVSAEENIHHYEVERSSNGIQFEKVSDVAFKLSGTAHNNYAYLDITATSQMVYYRIREVDNNGKYMYSKVVSVRLKQTMVVQLMPNPAIDKTSIYLTSDKAQKGTLQLLNVSGTVVRQMPITFTKGANQLLLDGLQQYARSTYFIKIVLADEVIFKKLILQ